VKSKIGLDVVERAHRALEALPQYQPDELTKAQAVKKLLGSIRATRSKGYSLAAISKLFSECGIPITTGALRAYLSDASGAGGKKRRRRAKPRADATIDGVRASSNAASEPDGRRALPRLGKNRLLRLQDAAAPCFRKAKLEGRARVIEPGRRFTGRHARRSERGTISMWSREATAYSARPAAFARASRIAPVLHRLPPDVRERLRRPTEARMKKEQWVRKWNSWVDPRAGAARGLQEKGGRVSRSRASRRSEDWIDAAGCPKPAGPGGTRGGPSLVEDGARLDPQGRKPADEQAARALRDVRRFLAARKS
jgi:hypothetical protein